MLKNRKLIISSWAMYDFANTIFSMNVISLYFALWVTVDMHGPDIYYSIAMATSMLMSALTAPILGAISDRAGRRKPFLISFTLLSCVFTIAIGLTHNLLTGLICFVFANYGFQIGDTFYNSLLPHVSEGKNTGRISGFGTGLGYLGTIAGLLLVSPFVLKFGRHAAFIPTACYFFIFALPCFIFVPEIKQPNTLQKLKHNIAKTIFHTATVLPIIKSALKQIRDTFINIKKYKALFYFLITAFIALNAINTVYIFMSIYIKKIGGFSDQHMIVFYIISSIFAIAGAFSIGFLTDILGPKRTFRYVLLLWCVNALFATFNHYAPLFWLIGPLAGICLGGTWTSARALVVALAPKEMIGEVFGFYGFVGKTAAIVGPMIWGVTVWIFGPLGLTKYRIAVFVLFLFLLLSLVVLKKVPERSK
ncbi:MAG: MFS transporter [Gammaproteobacteria bacterium]|nr:MFS transporter [Gammaproteobacteria bacterium]